ncbi:MAG TPA: hypothetical protein VI958_12885, partial [Acidobacteriota bacterium]
MIRFLFLCMALPMVAPAAVLHVNGGSIQSAIDAAEPGDQIVVTSGTYPGDLVIDKTILLEGIGKPVIRGSGRRSVITVTATGCLVKGFVIEGSGSDLQSEHSGILLKSDRNRIESNELRDVLFGIYLFQSDENLIRGQSIYGRSYLESGERGSG